MSRIGRMEERKVAGGLGGSGEGSKMNINKTVKYNKAFEPPYLQDTIKFLSPSPNRSTITLLSQKSKS